MEPMNRPTDHTPLALINAAVHDEVERLNVALIVQGKTAILPTAFGDYEVLSVSQDLWAACKPAGSEATRWNTRSFALANDGAWADLLRQAGVERNDLWARRS